ncbi:MAG: HDOD domain-containing protein [gamma proteobacterium symbiont of Ctena orbiculata]|nr:HDOD domain-containing protein [Candidatus Thiodiazotropha sp. (ex Lucina pensylvanica)]MBT3063944.1 HDOD domain-containing protein [Candidatus Thiodiazotropha sp. (ex Lucina pensylvanica)]MBV2096088.1 HDOD domain-containing protein [Candidatus Thiodiazotropha sp. (ex Codakia orbicularis)]PUB74612.1 MAG: phosphohydrolase [gamma proteobacterium symbiont of Ctena orbiculata]PUB75138.1 MAG: phosphohydrolase [gamma proteobacterium symbiont of Ctena orbiculata]
MSSAEVELMTPQQLVIEIENLVSLPDVCVKVNRLIDAPNYSAATLGEIISQDTDLSARLLRLVNSAFFNFEAPVETISRAVTVVGTNELRNLVMATTAARIFTGIPGDLVDMAEYWRYSITTGVIAGELAKRCNVLHSERLFVMGVLHDIGRLAIYLKMPQAARDILLITGGDDALLADAENDVLGFTHMDVGEALLRKWKLPESIVTVVAYHHRPMATKVFQLETSLLYLASSLANAEIGGAEWEEAIVLVDPVIWRQTGLDPEQLASLLEEIPRKVMEVMDVVLGPKVRPVQSQPH